MTAGPLQASVAPGPEGWDLDALDRDAGRARLWAWFPLLVFLFVGLGYAGSAVVLVMGAVMNTPLPVMIVGGLLPTLIPLVGGLAVHVWRIREASRHLPGPALSVRERVLRAAAVAGIFGIPLVAWWGLGGSGAQLPVSATALLLWLVWLGLLTPSDAWTPRRSTRVVRGLLVSAPTLAMGTLASSLAWSPALGMVAVTVPLLLAAWATRRRLLGLYALRAQGRHDEAVAALRTGQGVGAAPALKAAILMHAGRVDDAYALCVERTRRTPRGHWPAMLSLGGELARLLGRVDEANAHCDALLRVAPERPEGYALAATLALDAGASPDRCLAWLDRAATHVARGNVFAGAGALQRAASTAWHVRLGLLRATALARAGQTVDAGRELDAAIAAIDETDRPGAARQHLASLPALRALGRPEGPARDRVAALDPHGIGGWSLRALEAARPDQPVAAT